jgi:hypothetical protein
MARQARLNTLLRLGLTMEEAQDAVMRADDAADEVHEGAGGGGAALAPVHERRTALAAPRDDAARAAEAALATALDPPKALADAVEALTEACAGVFVAFLRALRADVAEARARERLAPLVRAAVRARAAWEAGGRAGAPPAPAPAPPSAAAADDGAPIPPPNEDAVLAVCGVLPWAVADAVFHALVAMLPGSARALTGHVKLTVFLNVGRLLSGVELAPVAALDAMEGAFQPLLQLPRDCPSSRAPLPAPAASYKLVDPGEPVDAFGAAGRLCLTALPKPSGAAAVAAAAAAAFATAGSERPPTPPPPPPLRFLTGPSAAPAPPRNPAEQRAAFAEQARLLGFASQSTAFPTVGEGERAQLGLRGTVRAELLRAVEPHAALPPSVFLAAGAAIPRAAVAATADLSSLLPPLQALPLAGSAAAAGLAAARSHLAASAAALRGASLASLGADGTLPPPGGGSARQRKKLASPLASVQLRSFLMSSNKAHGKGGKGAAPSASPPSPAALDAEPSLALTEGGGTGGGGLFSPMRPAPSPPHRPRLAAVLHAHAVALGVSADAEAASAWWATERSSAGGGGGGGGSGGGNGGGGGGVGDTPAASAPRVEPQASPAVPYTSIAGATGMPAVPVKIAQTMLLHRAVKPRGLSAPFFTSAPSSLLSRGLLSEVEAAVAAAALDGDGALAGAATREGSDGVVGGGGGARTAALPSALRGGFVARAVHRSLPLPWAEAGGMDSYFSSQLGTFASTAAPQEVVRELRASKARAVNYTAVQENVISAGLSKDHASLRLNNNTTDLGIRVNAVTAARKARMQARLEAAQRGAEERLEARLNRFVGGNVVSPAGRKDGEGGAQAERVLNLHNLAAMAQQAGVYSGTLHFA